MPNIVYVLTNPAMPGMVKIGMTDRADVQRRMNELYSTGVPLPFECTIARQIEGKEAAEIENALHIAFDPYRVNPSREFFEIYPEQVEVLLRVMSGTDATPQIAQEDTVLLTEDREAAAEYKKRQSLTNEREFLGSLNDDGLRVFERVLALAQQKSMRVKWGRKGFSLNAISKGSAIAICYGYPPSSVYKQSIYTDFASLNEKTNIPTEVFELLQKEALDIDVFVPVGLKNELACRINQGLGDSQIDALIDWLGGMSDRIREFESTDPC